MKSMLLSSVALSGCTMMVQGAFHLSDKNYSESSIEPAPTSETLTHTEYELVEDSLGAAFLCVQRQRQVDRHFQIHKKFEYRGGYDSDTYAGSAFVSGLAAAIVAGTYAGVCLQDDASSACWNTAILWSPLLLDVGYGIYKAKTVRKPVLVDRVKVDAGTGLGRVVSETPMDCQSVRQVVLAEKTSWQAPLTLDAEGRVASVTLGPDRTVVPLLEGGRLPSSFLSEQGSRWVRSPRLELWVETTDGRVLPVAYNRCQLLAPYRSALTEEEQRSIDVSCPVSPLVPSGGAP